MSQSASFGQAPSTRKLSPLAAGLGAAFIACAMTATMMASGPASASAQAEASAKVCRSLPLMLMVSTTSGGGTVRFREGDFLSPPFTLGTKPQQVTFARSRPEAGVLEEQITIEGDATDLVTTSPVTSNQTVYPKISGALVITARWLPAKTC